VESFRTARQPEISAAIQNNTDNGSIVIKVAPTANSGVAALIGTSQKPIRALISRAKNRSSSRERMAAITGEKKRTPKTVSPHKWVPKNCV
jgi:hypothetical protein